MIRLNHDPLSVGEPTGPDPQPVELLGSTPGTSMPETVLRSLLDEGNLLAVGLDREGAVTYANAALRDAVDAPGVPILGRPWFADFIPGPDRERLLAEFAALLEPGAGAVRCTSGLLTRNGIRTVEWTTSALRDRDGKTVGSAAIGVDSTDRVATEIAHERLATAVEATADSVVITDPEARILYVNPAFERVTGFSRDEVVGENPRLLQSGHQAPEYYQAMWATLASGRTWRGTLRNRRKDGTEFVEEASITPIRGTTGDLLSYVGVKRDVTAIHALQELVPDGSLDVAWRISAMVGDLVPGDSAETTALRISERMLTLPGVAFAGVAVFQPGDALRSLAAVAIDGAAIDTVTVGASDSGQIRARVRRFRRQAREGAWTEPWSRADPSPMRPALVRLGVQAMAMAPIRLDGEPIGFVTIGGDGRVELAPMLPILTSFGSLASLLLAAQLGDLARVDDARAEIDRIIRRRAFRPVFQPIVTMPGGRVVGYEALTRFADGERPDEVFALAARVGLGVELECATIAAAIAAATELPRDAWLDINVSPALLADSSRLGYELWKAGSRPLVLEVTEHEAIADYHELRRHVADLGVPVRIAVDDAGAGFASLRHILELRPAIIKLDRSLVVDIDGDPARQGLIAGLRHFASTLGSTVLAEGIETHAERAALLALGIELGQGFLLGRPAPIGLTRRTARRPRAAADVPAGAAEAAGEIEPGRAAPSGAILWEADGTAERMTFVSERATIVTGHPVARWLMEPRFWEDHVHPDDRASVLAAVATAMSSGERVSLEYRFRLADGSYRWFEDVVEILPGTAGHVRLIGVMIDVTDRRQLQEQLAHRASHDALTGLLNRQGLHDAVVRTALLTGEVSALLLLDLDRFKVVNDTLGHEAGDELLRRVAERLRSAVRATDAVARIGGDEFVVVATADSSDAVIELGRRLVDVVAAPSVVAGRTLAHPASIGLDVIAADEPFGTAMANADIALSAARQAGGNRIVVYDRSLRGDGTANGLEALEQVAVEGSDGADEGSDGADEGLTRG